MRDLFHITIDGIAVEAAPGTTILEAALSVGIEIPTLCHDERIEPYGACGLCVVEAAGSPKLLRACSVKISDGMDIQTKSERVCRSRKFALDMLLSNHTGDCKAPCSLACPAGTDCQGYVGLLANGAYKQALRLIKERIPLPAAIGRVCPHPCQTACRRSLVEEPIQIAYLKGFAADVDLQSDSPYMPPVAPPNGKTVAVIGGGPGGLTAAYFLRIKGYSVKIYDKMPKMGGMLRYGIPSYRLSKETLDKEIELIRALGIEFYNNRALGRDFTIESLRAENDAVVVAVGAWKSSPMRVVGEELDGVYGGIDFLRSVIEGKPLPIGERVAVCGGGNTAMDACRTAVRLGAREVYVVYRRTRNEMPAEKLEIDEAEEEGVIYKFLTNPAALYGKNGRVEQMKLQIMRLGEPDAGGRRSPVPVEGQFETLDVDSVIMAIGQQTDPTGLASLTLTRRGTIAADENTFATNIEGVFAVGDATNKGASIAVEAIGEAHKAAEVVDSYLKGCTVGYQKPFVVEKEVTEADFADRERLPAAKMPTRSPSDRKGDFDEITLGFSAEVARQEAARCLECGCLDCFQCKLLRFAREYGVSPAVYTGEKSQCGKDDSHPYILHDHDKCILCGQCVRVCDEVMGVTALGLVNRGFETVVSPEFHTDLARSRCISCGQCVALCPTGALAAKTPARKSVPLEEELSEDVCHGCARLCPVRVHSVGETVLRCTPGDAKTILCKDGAFNFKEINAPYYARTCFVDGRELTLDEAAALLAEKESGATVLVNASVCDDTLDAVVALAKKYNAVLRYYNATNATEKEAAVFGEKRTLGSNIDKLRTLNLQAVDKLPDSLFAPKLSKES